jgi:hypothetical protein
MAAFIFAGYLCLKQNSLAVFTLASCGMAVSPFLLVSIRLLHVHPPEDVSFLLQGPASQQMPFGTTVLY